MIRMKIYRVDKRSFKEGDTIKPNCKFEEGLYGEKAELEAMLNNLRAPGIPERSKCLFLFQDLAGALRYMAKYGGIIYSVFPNKVFYRGDMNKLDNILDVFRFTSDENLRTDVVNEYWKPGTHTYNPCYEILTDQAEVASVICGEDIQARIKEELITMGNCIERCPIYFELIKKLYPNI